MARCYHQRRRGLDVSAAADYSIPTRTTPDIFTSTEPGGSSPGSVTVNCHDHPSSPTSRRYPGLYQGDPAPRSIRRRASEPMSSLPISIPPPQRVALAASSSLRKIYRYP